MENYLKIPVRYVNQFEMRKQNPNVRYTQDVIDYHNQSSPLERLENYMIGKSIEQGLPERGDIDYLPERDERGHFGDDIPVAPRKKIPTRFKSNRR